jgi:DNA-directed RNA polymerase delta subunit
MKISLVDAAYEYLRTVNSAIAFADLYNAAADKASLAEDLKKRKKNSFYSQLSLDSRFMQCEHNTWDLKENHSFEESRIAVEVIDTDDDEEEEMIGENEDEEENDADDDAEHSSPVVYPVPESSEEY